MKKFLLGLISVFVVASAGLVMSGQFEDLHTKTFITPNLAGYTTATLPTAGIAGRIAYDTTTGQLSVDNGTAWRSIQNTTTATVDFASTAATVCSADSQVTVTGAAVNDIVTVGPPATVNQGSMFQGYVSAANTVQIKHCNMSAGAVDPASATYRVTVLKP